MRFKSVYVRQMHETGVFSSPHISAYLHVRPGDHAAAISKDQTWNSLSQCSGTNRDLLTPLVTSAACQQVLLPLISAVLYTPVLYKTGRNSLFAEGTRPFQKCDQVKLKGINYLKLR